MCGAYVSYLDHEGSKITKTHEEERFFQNGFSKHVVFFVRLRFLRVFVFNASSPL